MKMKMSLMLAFAFFAVAASAQTNPPAAPEAAVEMGGTPAPDHVKIIYRNEFGTWWKRSEVVKKLQLSDDQISHLDEVFSEHRTKLKQHTAEMATQDQKLQTLLDADVPNEGQINVQVDHVLAARGKLEREFTMMNLDLRKVLSLEQWRALKSMRGEHGAFGDRVFFQKFVGPGPGAGPTVVPLPPDTPLPPLPPGPAEEDLF
jgi:Spy/CpxP family protein refolding chaperone